MALFGNKKNDDNQPVPPQRVKGFATLDLEKLIENKPVTIDSIGEIDWEVDYESDKIVRAYGNIEVPVEIKFETGDLDNETVADDLVVLNIKIGGKKVLVSDLEKARIPFDVLDTIDTDDIEDRARKQFGADHID